jgi:hypothetical protein
VLGGDEPPPAFPVGVLPQPLARLVRAVASALPCPPDYVGVQMLPVLGTFIGRKRKVQAKAGWTEFPAVWALARRVHGTAAVRDGGRIGNALAWVRTPGGEVTARKVRMHGLTKTNEEAEQLLKDLAHHGHGTVTTPAGKSLEFRLSLPNHQLDDATADAGEGGAE